MQITFTISEAKKHRIIDAINGSYAVPTDVNGNPLFTPGQWAKEHLRRHIIEIVYSYDRREAKRIALGPINREDDLVS